MPHPKLRPATRADIEQFYGAQKKWSFRAVVADLDGEILGVGGVYYPTSHGGRVPVVFSEFRPEMKKFPVTMARGVFEIMKIIKGKTCYAVADKNIAGSDDLLIRLGFNHIGDGTYLCKPR